MYQVLHYTYLVLCMYNEAKIHTGTAVYSMQILPPAAPPAGPPRPGGGGS